MNKDRMPPYSEEAERGVLGSCLLDCGSVLDLCHRKGITPEHFYVPANEKIFAMILQFEKQKGLQRFDLAIFGQFLKDTGRLDEIGGTTFLERLIDGTPTSAHAEYYIEILESKYLLRKNIELGRKIVDACYDEDPNPKKILTATIHRACELSVYKHDDPSVKQMREASLRKVTNAKAGCPYGHETFMMPLNKVLIGWIPTNLYIVAAEPKCGKTTFAYNDAIFQAVIKKKPVAINSQEMSAPLLYEQMAGSLAGVNFHRMRNGDWTEEEYERIEMAYQRLEDAPLFISDRPMTIDEIHTWAVMSVTKRKAEIVYVDYLQKIRFDLRDRRTRNDLIGEATGIAKEFCKELDIPAIFLSQFSRSEFKQRKTTPPPPTPNMLRDSGSIEQDADCVILLYKKPDLDTSQFSDDNDWPMEISVAMNRAGPTGTKPAFLARSLQKWETIYEHEERMMAMKNAVDNS